jgi:hypothetical protein
LKSIKNWAKESKIPAGLLCFKADCEHIFILNKMAASNDANKLSPQYDGVAVIR